MAITPAAEVTEVTAAKVTEVTEIQAAKLASEGIDAMVVGQPERGCRTHRPEAKQIAGQRLSKTDKRQRRRKRGHCGTGIARMAVLNIRPGDCRGIGSWFLGSVLR
jgi:hypothetical protein